MSSSCAVSKYHCGVTLKEPPFRSRQDAVSFRARSCAALGRFGVRAVVAGRRDQCQAEDGHRGPTLVRWRGQSGRPNKDCYLERESAQRIGGVPFDRSPGARHNGCGFASSGPTRSWVLG